MTRYSTQHHPVIRSIAWEPEKPAEWLNDQILMSRSTSNAYLIPGDEGDLVINTGTPYQGERHRERFEQLLGRPLKVSKILFTQSHPDHIGGWASFADPGVETIVQREFPRICQERKMMARYFQPRGAKILFTMMPRKEHSDAWHHGTRDPEGLTLFDDSHAFLLGGRRVEALSIPSGETLDSLAVWLPGERTLFIGNWMGAIHGALPNFYTARGDRDRSVPGWLGEADMLMSLRPTLLITGHDDPVRGEAEVQAYLGKVRDAVRLIHDETVKGMNEHKDLWTLMGEIRLPAHLAPKPGRCPVSWVVRAVWEEYTGWFRAESTTELYPVPPATIWPDLVRLSGGPDALVAAARQRLEAGKPVEALHFVEIVLACEPTHRQGREAELAALEMLVEANGGLTFDELGWLETAIGQCRQVLGD